MQPTIRKNGTSLVLTFPARAGNPADHTHSITLPTNAKGFQAMLRILSAQELTGEKEPYIATEASPIQGMVDAWLRQGNKITSHKRREDVTLADLDLED